MEAAVVLVVLELGRLGSPATAGSGPGGSGERTNIQVSAAPTAVRPTRNQNECESP